MLSNAKALNGYTLECRDGDIGKVKEFYFDERHWTIRYLVADAGNWLTGRKVLISPYALSGIRKDEQHIVVDLTKKQIEESPPLDSDKPVSRQYEEAYHGYYGWPIYWGGPYPWGMYPYIMPNPEKTEEVNQESKGWDAHLHSTHDVTGYNIEATDGGIGHVEDFVIEDEVWAIRYLIIDTLNWWPGKKVIVSPQWIDRISASESKMYVDLSRETVKESPEYSEESFLTRDYETALHRHYDRRGYWDDDPAREKNDR